MVDWAFIVCLFFSCEKVQFDRRQETQEIMSRATIIVMPTYKKLQQIALEEVNKINKIYPSLGEFKIVNSVCDET